MNLIKFYAQFFIFLNLFEVKDMIKKLNNIDFLFVISLMFGILSLSIYLFNLPYLYGEAYVSKNKSGNLTLKFFYAIIFSDLNLTGGENMIKKLTKTDLLFIISLIIGILSLSIYLFTHPYFYDETFYISIPYRLINGDSLIQHEWHLTQFSSLFTYFPVKIWLALKGSSEGILVFLRCFYFLIHTTATAAIYKFFRKHGNWAIAAAMIFFTQVSYRIFGISYNSMFVLFTLLFSFSLLSIYKNNSKHLYVIAGTCFACSCVCNPLYCFAFILYLVACAVWTKRALVKSFVIKIKTFCISKTKKNVAKNKKNDMNEIVAFPNMESYNCFFSKEAVLYSFLGILVVAVFAVAFFFATGGTINSVFENIQNLLNNSEYFVTSFSFIDKIESTRYFFNMISFNAPYILPLFFLILFLDFRRKDLIRRCIYLSISLAISIVYMFGIFKTFSFYTNFFSLPFIIFSITCYILTDKKNKNLFRFMWIPSAIAAFFQYISANTMLTTLGLVLAIGNIAGVIFVKDLFNEIKIEPNAKAKTKRQKKQPKELIPFSRCLLCIGLCAQILFHGYVLQYEQIPYTKTTRATSGPYSGIIMTEQLHQSYTSVLSDFDLINSLNTEKTPVLIVSCKNWLYLYNESPMATHTSWCTNIISKDPLITYYTENPDKIPKYIYVDIFDSDNNYSPDLQQFNLDVVSEMFEFTKEDLSHGALLTVEKCKF